MTEWNGVWFATMKISSAVPTSMIGSKLVTGWNAVVGDSVNLAARLESNAKPGQILISHRTLQRVDGVVNVRSLGVIRVKGKEEQVDVYEVLGLTQSV